MPLVASALAVASASASAAADAAAAVVVVVVPAAPDDGLGGTVATAVADGALVAVTVAVCAATLRGVATQPRLVLRYSRSCWNGGVHETSLRRRHRGYRGIPGQLHRNRLRSPGGRQWIFHLRWMGPACCGVCVREQSCRVWVYRSGCIKESERKQKKEENKNEGKEGRKTVKKKGVSMI